MEKGPLDTRLRLMQDSDMKGKVVLARVDHNVVKNGQIKDPFRIEATLGTLYGIVEGGGRPILITHVGRPRDKKTGTIVCRSGESVDPIVRYLRERLPIEIHSPSFSTSEENGIEHLDSSVHPAIESLRAGEIGMIYLPNSRWFRGEEAKGPERDQFARELGEIADLYLNDAFGSYRPHASTYDVTRYLPSFAGALLQKELKNLHQVLEPERPFVAVIAGAKFDTKVGPLRTLYEKVDHLLLGGVMYNTFLAAKHGIRFSGVSEEDTKLASELVELDRDQNKIIEPSYLVASETLEGKNDGKFRKMRISDLKEGQQGSYGVDVHPDSFRDRQVQRAIEGARTIFVNAVMGLMPHYGDGSRTLYELVDSNRSAMKLFGGGDTLEALKGLSPGVYMRGMDSPDTYYFTGGGSVLAAIERGNPYALEPIGALMEPSS